MSTQQASKCHEISGVCTCLESTAFNRKKPRGSTGSKHFAKKMINPLHAVVHPKRLGGVCGTSPRFALHSKRAFTTEKEGQGETPRKDKQL